MSQYYYLLASLPMLSFETKPPMSGQELLRQCQGQLSEAHYKDFESILTADESDWTAGHDIIIQWKIFSHHLRNEIAYVRATKSGKDPSAHVRGVRESLPIFSEMVQQASKASDPLSGEKIFDQRRWQLLDDLGGGHYFDFDALIVYGLKLKILERYELIASDVGKSKFEEYKKIPINVN